MTNTSPTTKPVQFIRAEGPPCVFLHLREEGPGSLGECGPFAISLPKILAVIQFPDELKALTAWWTLVINGYFSVSGEVTVPFN